MVFPLDPWQGAYSSFLLMGGGGGGGWRQDRVMSVLLSAMSLPVFLDGGGGGHFC